MTEFMILYPNVARHTESQKLIKSNVQLLKRIFLFRKLKTVI